MSVIINNSVSLDGYICGPHGEESWISDADATYFEKACSAADMIVLGSGTFDANTDLYPVPGKENIVFTRTAAERTPVEGITFTNQDPVSFVKEHKDKHILVAGGGTLNATLLKAGVVTDIVIAIHPIILGAGKRQFDGIDFDHSATLQKVSHEDIGEDVVLIKYTVQKSI